MTLPLEEDKLGVYIKLLETDVWIHKTNIATKLAIEENSKKLDKIDEQLVLAEYHEYLNIFSEEKAHRFPESRPWDHKIKIKEGFGRTNRTGQILEGKPRKRVYSAISIANGLPIFLCFQERWQTSTLPRLPVFK
jgi:hypothetical protein